MDFCKDSLTDSSSSSPSSTTPIDASVVSSDSDSSQGGAAHGWLQTLTFSSKTVPTGQEKVYFWKYPRPVKSTHR